MCSVSDTAKWQQLVNKDLYLAHGKLVKLAALNLSSI